MPDSHAILSASASHRWLMCPPSVRLCEQFPGDGASEFAAEGTEAHALCEFKLKTALGMDATLLILRPNFPVTARRWMSAPPAMPPLFWSW